MKKDKVENVAKYIKLFFEETDKKEAKISEIKKHIEINHKGELASEGWAGTLLYNAYNNNLLEDFGIYPILIGNVKSFRISTSVDDDDKDLSASNNTKQEKDYYSDIETYFKSDDNIVKVLGAGGTGKGAKGDNHWRFPDLVACKFVFENEDCRTYDIASKLENKNKIEFSSYEIKIKDFTKNKIREYYFQAVANSSWANYGYLVLVITKDTLTKINKELERLSNHHGIGVAIYDETSDEKFEVVFHARKNDKLDYENMRILETQNDDFKEFLFQVNRKI